jgi:hypothetical protein
LALTLVATMAVAGPLSGYATAKTAELSVSDVWCLQPDNRAVVVQTAVAEGLGTAKGKDDGRFLPTGSDEPLDLEQWRQDPELEFERICERTYESLTGNSAAGPAKASEDDIPWYGEVGITGVGGGVAALIGGFAGFGLRGLERGKEQKHQRAEGITEGLGNLNAALADLPDRYLANTATAGRRKPAEQLVKELEARLPASPKPEAGKAKESLVALNGLLGPVPATSEGRQERYDQLRKASGQMNVAVVELICALGGDAAGAS